MWSRPYTEDSPRGWIEKDDFLGPTGDDVVLDIGDLVPVGEAVSGSCVGL